MKYYFVKIHYLLLGYLALTGPQITLYTHYKSEGRASVLDFSRTEILIGLIEYSL